MRLKRVTLLQNIAIALTAVLMSGVILININYKLRVKSEIDSIFLDTEVVEKGFRNLGIDTSLVFDVEEMYKKLNFVLDDTRLLLGSMGIVLDIYFYKNSDITYNYDFRDMEVVSRALQGRRSYTIKTDIDNRTFLYSASPSLEEFGNCVIFIRKDITKIKIDRRNQYLILILVTLILSIVLIPISLYLSNRVSKPINNLIFNISNFFNKELYKRSYNTSITEVKKLDREFSNLVEIIDNKIELLKNESYNKELFINKLNHELNTPITSIIGFSNLLLTNSYPEERIFEFISNIKREGERVRDLNSNLQELLLPLDDYLFEEFSLCSLIEEVIVTLRASIDRKLIEVNLDIRDSKIKGNRVLLHSLLKNILENSINASNKGDRIDILFNKEESPLLRVIDSGVGIPEKEIESIMKPYFKGSRNSKPSKGLGLYICDEIVKYHKCSFNLRNIEKGVSAEVDFTTILQLC